jgi:hypothetical protein
MEFNLIDYKLFKMKYILKFTQLFFFFNSTRLKSRNWVLVEQALNNIKLKYYKVYNISTNKIVTSSIFRNGNKIVNGSTLLVSLNSKEANNINFPMTTKLITAHQLLTFLSIKINNKVYSNFQIERINFSNYTRNLLTFCYTIKKNLKKQLIMNLNNKIKSTLLEVCLNLS